jgi:hypothetical protein
MALDTVQNYVTDARVLLQDNIAPYRYPDTDLLEALNLSILEARLMRPDLFIGRFDAIPSFATVDTTAVVMDYQYRTALLYFIVAFVELRDAEETQDSRVAALFGKFKSQLLSLGG